MKLGTLLFRPNGGAKAPYAPTQAGRFYIDLGADGWIKNPATGKVEKWIEVPGVSTFGDKPAALAYRERYARERARLGATTTTTSQVETASQWWSRYHDACEVGDAGRRNEGKPQAKVGRRRRIYSQWVEPVVGALTMKEIAPAHVAAVVRALDAEIKIRDAYERGETTERRANGVKPGLTRITAACMFGEIKTGLDEATHSKNETLKCLDVDPSKGVRPPAAGRARRQEALLPAEVLMLVNCRDVDIIRRRTYAAAIYLGVRREELTGIKAKDVDLVNGVVLVHGTKTHAAERAVPIPAPLRPLLVALCNTYPDEPLFEVSGCEGTGGAADNVRKDLMRAGVTRPAIYLDNAVHMRFTFHALRHTCITHWCVAGKDVNWILSASGHTDVALTRRYLDASASMRETFGTPAPPASRGSSIRSRI